MKFKGCSNSKYKSYEIPKHGTTITVDSPRYPSFTEKNRNCTSMLEDQMKQMALYERVRYKR
jgi:hypothetical protein